MICLTWTRRSRMQSNPCLEPTYLIICPQHLRGGIYKITRLDHSHRNKLTPPPLAVTVAGHLGGFCPIRRLEPLFAWIRIFLLLSARLWVDPPATSCNIQLYGRLTCKFWSKCAWMHIKSDAAGSNRICADPDVINELAHLCPKSVRWHICATMQQRVGSHDRRNLSITYLRHSFHSFYQELALLPHNQLSTSTDLANTLMWFERSCQLDDLGEAISFNQEALELRSSPIPINLLLWTISWMHWKFNLSNELNGDLDIAVNVVMNFLMHCQRTTRCLLIFSPSSDYTYNGILPYSRTWWLGSWCCMTPLMPVNQISRTK